jgi:hypothetical protein
MDFTIQKCFRSFCSALKLEEFKVHVSRPDAHLSTVPSVQTMCLTVRTPDRPSIIHPDDMHFRSDLYCIEKLLFQHCIRPDISAAHPDAYQ